MKWFKHISDASEDDFIENLEEIFGLEGYARWFKLLEKIAVEMDETGECSAKHSWVKWQSFLKGKRNKLETFLYHCQNENKIKLELIGNMLKITCPKLLELRDNHTKNLQATSKGACKSLAPKNQDQELDKEDKTSSLIGKGLDVDNSGLKSATQPLAKEDFNVDSFLTDVDRMCVRAESNKWDYDALVITFNTFVKRNEIPKNPSAAFLAWVISFTKGKPPC